MEPSSSSDYSPELNRLIGRAGLSSVQDLSLKADVSRWQIIRLRRGLARQMRVEVLLKIARGLNISLVELLATFAPDAVSSPQAGASVEELQREYQRLQDEMEGQRQSLLREFERTSLDVLEAWLVQWPTAVYRIKENSLFSPKTFETLLRLLRPVDRLVQQWKVEAIATVGSKVPYNPQIHQLLEGTANIGETVVVRYAGYRYRGQLLHRAKVSPPSPERP